MTDTLTLLPEGTTPIDGSHLFNTPCTTGCGSTVVAALGQLTTALCSPCRVDQLGPVTLPPPNRCICGSENTHPYPAGARCDDCAKQLIRKDWYGFAIPRDWTQYDPSRLANAPVWTGVRFAGEPPPVSDFNAGCLVRTCHATWPLNSLEDALLSIHAHELVMHRENAWMVGGVGGSNTRICDPCGGASPGGWALVEGERVELPPKGSPFGITFKSARHDLCLNGHSRGRGQTYECDCKHRTPEQQQPHLKGKKQ